MCSSRLLSITIFLSLSKHLWDPSCWACILWGSSLSEPVQYSRSLKQSDDHIPSSQPELHSPGDQLSWSLLCFDRLLSQAAAIISCAGDLKPDNIFFDSQGVLKLGDFGLAKFQPLPGDPALSGICRDITTCCGSCKLKSTPG